jgi:hypothetical protein
MPGGFKNGQMYRATGFRLLEQTAIAEDEVRTKIFLEGQNQVLKLVFKRVGGEWKWSSNSP